MWPHLPWPLPLLAWLWCCQLSILVTSWLSIYLLGHGVASSPHLPSIDCWLLICYATVIVTASAAAVATTCLAVVLPVVHACNQLIVDCWYVMPQSLLLFAPLAWQCADTFSTSSCQMWWCTHQASQKHLRTVVIRCITKAHCRCVMINWSLKVSKKPTEGRIDHYQNLLRDRTCQGNHLCWRDQKCCIWQSICLTHPCTHLCGREQECSPPWWMVKRHFANWMTMATRWHGNSSRWEFDIIKWRISLSKEWQSWMAWQKDRGCCTIRQCTVPVGSSENCWNQRWCCL